MHGYRSAAPPATWDAAIAAEARWNPGVHPDNYRLTDAAAAVEELARSPRPAAGRSSSSPRRPWAATCAGSPRSPRSPASTSSRAPASTSRPIHAPWVAAATSDDELADRLLAEIRDGIDDTGIRPGIYGEIGTSDPVAPAERRVLRAVAAAAAASGLAISVHVHPWGHEGAGGARRADRWPAPIRSG